MNMLQAGIKFGLRSERLACWPQDLCSKI